MASWAEWMYGEIDAPLISTLSLYRSDGLVLLDVDSNYAAYGNYAVKLDDNEREAVGSVENNYDLVIRFDSCAPALKDKVFEGAVSQVRVKKKHEDAAGMAEDIRELVDFASKSNFTLWGAGASTSKSDQVYMGWTDNNGVLSELQINKDTHQLVWASYKKCEKVEQQ